MTKCQSDRIMNFITAISENRFDAYKEKAGDYKKAFELYSWNRMVSSQFYCILQDLEVVLRVSIDKKLTESYGEEWYMDPWNNNIIRFNSNHSGQIKSVLNRIQKRENKKDLIPNIKHKILSELSFGFWTYLFGTGNEKRSKDEKNKEIIYDYHHTLWQKGELSSLFPPEVISKMQRKGIYNMILKLNELRNKIAHHHAIFYLPLEDLYLDIITLLDWLSQEVRDYAISTTQIPYLLKNRDIITPYVEYIVGYRYATRIDALDAIRSLYLKICSEVPDNEKQDIELRRPELFHFKFGLIPIQNFVEPNNWGIICTNEKYADKFRNKVSNDWP